MRPQNTLLAALALAAGIASADPILPAGTAAANTAAIQSAIDAAGNGGTVTLGAGLFEIDSQLMVTNGVTLAGQGWEKTIIKQTATSGLDKRVLTIDGGSTVRGVTLTGGLLTQVTSTGANWKNGGGVYVADGTVSWCCISNNASLAGNCNYGGGVFLNKGQVDHSIIAGNRVTSTSGTEAYGGGISIRQNSGVLIDKCLVYGNSAVNNGHAGFGGGIGFDSMINGSVTIRNTTIAGNSAGDADAASAAHGGAVCSKAGSWLEMYNCVISGNTTAGTNATVDLVYDADVDYCLFDVADDKAGDHSLVGDAAFVDAANGDYRLGADSLAVGTGKSYEGIGVDLANAAFVEPPSMGCYEYGDRAANPVFDPVSGTTFGSSTNVTLSCATEGATIHYTTDGSTPTDSSTEYTGPIPLLATTTIKARAYAPNLGPSAVVSATYTLKRPTPKPDDFAKCIEITISEALSPNEVTTGVPALFRLDEQAIAGFDYDDFTLPNGGDMMFADANGNPLPHEVDTWDASGESLVWVRLPSTAKGTTITMYYGNGAVSPAEPEEVWGGYVGVWHLNEASGDAQDATGHGLVAVPTGAASATDSVGVACQVGNGRQMATAQGRKSYLAVADSPLLDCGDSLTFSGWFKATDTFANYGMRYVSRKNSYQDANGWEAEARYSGNVTNSATMVSARGSGSGDHWVTVPDVRKNWLHLALVYSGTTVTFYVNGVAQTPIEMSGKAAADNDLPLAFGNNAAGSESNWVGFMDELRLSADAASADYAIAEYKAMDLSGAEVFRYGDAHDVGDFDPAPPTLGTVTVAPQATSATIAGTIVSVGNNGATACDVYLSLDGGAATKVVSGATTAFAYTISGLTAETAYAYALTVSNNAAAPMGVTTNGTFTTTATPIGIQPVEGDPAATRWTIQAAIDAAAILPEPGTVTLAAGLFEIDAQLMVTGGVTLAGQGMDYTVIKQTLEGLDKRVMTIDGGSTVERLTITGGHPTQTTMEDGRIENNWNNGAGAHVVDGTISWCCISNNVALTGNDNYGGGVFLRKGRIDHSIIASNRVATTTHTEAFGGGIAARNLLGPVEIDTCLVYGNSVVNTAKAGFGGGIAVEYLYFDRSTAFTVLNTTIVGNSAGAEDASGAAEGGAVYAKVSSYPDPSNGFSMTNCIVAANVTANATATVAASDPSKVDWCLFDVADDRLGDNSLVGAPAFVDPENEDFRLSLESPAVGAGEYYEGLGDDLAGAAFSETPSMGCYEYGELAAKPVFDPASGAVFYPTTNVAVTCATEGAVLRYTTDGSRPTRTSPIYEGPIALAASATIRVRAFAEGIGPSAIATATFTYGSSTNAAKAGDTEYPTVEEAVKSGKEPVELLRDATWDPTTPGEYTITTNGFDLQIGGDLEHSVKDNGDGTITVTVTEGVVRVRAKSIAVGATTVLVGVEGIKADCWYALEKTTDLAQAFVLDESTWTKGSVLLAGTGELEIAIGENETCAFYQVRESDKEPNP